MHLLRHRWALSLSLTLGLVILWWLAPPARPDEYAAFVLWGFLVAICLPLPWRVATAVVGGASALQAALSGINAAKVLMTRAPLTALDFEIALANPRGLWLALGWPQWTRYVVFGGMAAAIGAWLWATGRVVRRRASEPSHRVQGWVSLAAATAGLAAFVATLPDALQAHANHDDDMWNTEALSGYSNRTGIVPFLIYSYALERRNAGPYYTAAREPAPSSDQVYDTAARWVRPAAPPKSLPNIAVVFAESTFNPNWAFVLARPVESALFRRQPDTHALSGLYVNTVGGGSWITEFESIVGVDSRLFGYSGYYTHTTLSPFVRRSFVTYLRGKGYDTAAYYSWAGDFYNAREAYANYGFERFVDVHELGLREFSGSDVDVATRTVGRMKAWPTDRPSFSYVVLYENHAPHRCEHFTEASALAAAFQPAVPFAKNCELNEYLRRMASTERAVEVVAAHLRDEERRTRRPYVLVVFGDHQPHTFTGTKSPPLSNYDYATQRRPASERETFLHIRASAPNPLRCCDADPPPVFLLPTLMSAYVARGVDDVYLPQNFGAYEGCGSEILGSIQVALGEGASRAVTRAARPECRVAYGKWLASIRAAGVI